MFGNMGGSVDLGSVHGRIIITTNAGEAVAQTRRELQTGLNGMSQQLQSMGNQIAGIGGQVTAMTAPLNLFMATGVRSFAALENSLVAIQARTGSTAETMERVSELTTQLGADTIFTSKQAADALLQLMSAGLSLEDAMVTLPDVLDGAAASQTDLALAADLTTNIMSSFGLGVEDTERIINQLVKAGASSPATFRELGEALQGAGGLARQFGVSLEDTTAVMAIFAQNGIRGPEAYTQMRSMLLNMNRDTNDVKAAWADLGVSMYDAQGAMRPLNDIMKDLDAALDPLTMEEQNYYITTLAGSYGLLGFNALRNSAGIDAMSDAIAGQEDASNVAAGAMLSLQNTFNSLRGSIESLQQSALKGFVESDLKPALRTMIEWTNQLRTLAEENPEIVLTIVRLLLALGAIGPVLFAAGKAVSTFGFVLGALTNPFGLLIAAATALWVAWQHNIGGMRDLLEPVVANVSKGLTAITSSVMGFVENIGSYGIREAVLGIFGMGSNGDTVQSSLEGILVSFGMTREAAAGLVESLKPMVGSLAGLWDSSSAGLNSLVAWFTETGLPIAMTFIMGTALPALQTLSVWLMGLWLNSVAGLQALAGWFTETGLPAAMTIINGVVIPALQLMGTVLMDLWTKAQPHLAALGKYFTETTLPAVMEFLNTVVMPALQQFPQWLVSIWEIASPYLLMVSGWFTDILMAAIDLLVNVGLPMFGVFVNFLVGVWELVSPPLLALAKWFVVTLGAALTFVDETIMPSLRTFVDFVVLIWTLVSPGLMALQNGFFAVATWIRDNVINPLMGWIDGLIQKILDFMNMIVPLQDAAAGLESTVSGARNVATAVQQNNIGAGQFLRVAAGAVASEFGWRDEGGPGVPGGVYAIGRNAGVEAFVTPEVRGDFIANLDKLIAAAAGGAGGNTFNVTVNANSEEGGRAAARGFHDELVRKGLA